VNGSARSGSSITTSAAVATLVVLSLINFVNYVDRYVLAAVLDQVRGDAAFAGVSDARFGLLQGAFMAVYLVFAPLGGLAGRRVPRRWIVASGVLLWSVATAWSGLARGYGELACARAMVGFGEAGYVAVAPAVITDLFHPRLRARMMSVFYLATPVGSALGFVVGGAIADRWGWRPAFFAASLPGIALALAALFVAEPARGARDPAGGEPLALGEGLRRLWNREFLVVTAGGALMTFSVGGLAFWMPTYFQEVRAMKAGAANLAFGGIAVVAGLVGTFAGGFLGDAWRRRDPRAYTRLSGLSLLAAAPAALAMPFAPTLPLTFALAFVAELFVFLNTGPLNTALVESAPAQVRELGVGLNVLAIHLFGDAFSPFLLGALSDGLRRAGARPDQSLSAAVAATALPLIAGAAVLLRGARGPKGAAP
jgi:predicted MFS family arabinose efflux permease